MVRKTEEERRAALVLKIEQARQRLNQLEQRTNAKARAQDTKRKIVVGGTVLATLPKDDAFKAQIVALLREKVTRPSDRAVIADLLT